MSRVSKTMVTRVIDREGHPALERAPLYLKPAKKARWSQATRFLQDTISIGSATANDFVIDDGSVSRHHARIELVDGALTLVDLDSTNGTSVGGVRVSQAFLPAKGSITLGDFEVQYRLGTDVDEVSLGQRTSFGEWVGQGTLARKLYSELEAYAASSATVLLTGESGTGKELLARGIHESSPRKDGPYVIVDCGALPRNLIESELFGHIRGAFTGAVSDRAGAFEQAHGGTVFLDEIGELDVALQPVLLRVLEQRSVKRVGSAEYTPVDVRVIAATNRDLHRQMANGEFREDLYYRLAVACAQVPPLRRRTEDIPLIIEHLLGQLRHRYSSLTLAELSADVVQALSQRKWPGNVRELRNALEQAVVTASFPTTGDVAASEEDDSLEINPDMPYHQARESLIARFERSYILAALDRSGGNVAQAARDCEMDRATLFRLLKKHDLRR